MAKRSNFLARKFSAIEMSAGNGWRWLPLLLGWITLRNILESVLEPPHLMGFDWRGEISFPMQFLHFPAFYLTLFFALVLYIQMLNRRPMKAVAGVVATGFGLLLLVPVIDALVTSGRGFDLRYMMGFGSVLWRFWDPTVSVAGISPGQRVEVAGACLLVAGYLYETNRWRDYTRGRALIIAFAGGGGLFLLTALLGAWPSIFSSWFSQVHETADQVYLRIFQGPGLISNDSRRHALVILLPLIPLLIVWLRGLNPQRFAVLVKHLAWTRLTYYSGLVVVGVMLAASIYRAYLPSAFSNPIDFVAVFVLWISMTAAYLAAGFWNDHSDFKADQINEPQRPLITGRVSLQEIALVGHACAVFALLSALCVGYQQFLWLLIVLVISWIYSQPPVRLKRWPLVATLTLALLSVCSAATGFSVFAAEMTPYLFPRSIALVLLVGVTCGFTAKDLKDVSGDKATGTVTFATILGLRWARLLAMLCTAFGFVFIPLIMPLGQWPTAICLIFAVVSAVVTLRIKKPDSALLLLLILFAALMATMLLRSGAASSILMPGSNLKLHGQISAAEMNLRQLNKANEREGNSSTVETGSIKAALWRENLRGCLSGFDLVEPEVTSDGALQAAVWRKRRQLLQAALEPPISRAGLYRSLAQNEQLTAKYWEKAALAYHQAGETDMAVQMCRQALRLGLRPGLFYRNAAALLAESGRGERELMASSMFSSDQVIFQVIAGDMRVKQNRNEEALEFYRRALELDSSLPEAYSGMGEALYGLGRLDEAISAFKCAVLLAGNDVLVLNNYGVVLRDRGRDAEAGEIFLRAHQLAPGFFEPIYNLAVLAEKQQRFGAALVWYQQANQIRPHFKPVKDAVRRLRSSSGAD